MDIEPIKGSWEEQKSKLKERFLNLTNSDLNYETDKREEILNKVQVRLGITKKEMADILSTL